MSRIWFGVLALIWTLGLPAQAAKKEIWVYTSIYKEFAAPIEAAFEAKNPDIDLNVYQAGSEKIQAKVEAELLAQKPQADVVLTSDPFWSASLQQRGLVWSSAGRPAIQTNYYSLMVLITHKSFPADKRPAAFSDLVKPEYKNLVHVGSPLESGTAFSTVAYLSRKYTWDFFEKMRVNQLAATGGNSTVIQKVESGEKKVGIVLLENALAAQKRGSPIEVIYPKDGAIAIPSTQVIFKSTKEPLATQKFADFILSDEGQRLLLNGYMYSINKKLPPPAGALPLSVVTQNSTAWSPALIDEVAKDAKQIKKKFAALILE